MGTGKQITLSGSVLYFGVCLLTLTCRFPFLVLPLWEVCLSGDTLWETSSWFPFRLCPGCPGSTSGHHQILLSMSVLDVRGVCLSLGAFWLCLWEWQQPSRFPFFESVLDDGLWLETPNSDQQIPLSGPDFQGIGSWWHFLGTIKQIHLSDSILDVRFCLPGNAFQLLTGRFPFLTLSLEQDLSTWWCFPGSIRILLADSFLNVGVC